MSTIRLDRSTGCWTAVPIRAIEDPRLDADSVGILAYLLVKPAGWEVRPQVLKSRFKLGRQAWARITRQLIECGYYRREVTRDDRGRLTTDIVVTPTPESVPPPPGVRLPTVGSPTSRLAGTSTKETNKLETEPPPAASGGETRIDAEPENSGGSNIELVDLAIANGLATAAARRFARAAHGAIPDQVETLRHELPLRLPGARDRVGVAITLAKLAARSELDDTTRSHRTDLARAAAHRAAEIARQTREISLTNETTARRAREGPSPAELAFRAYSKQIPRISK